MSQAGAGISNERLGLQAGTLALLAALLWGGNSVFIKLGLEGVPPLAMAGIRFVLGLVVVWAAALFSGISLRPGALEWRGLGGLGALFVAQIVLLNQGTYFTTAARSTVLMSTYPFFTAFFAHFFVPGDRLSTPKVVGLVLSFAGVVLIFAESLALPGIYLLGDVLVLFSGILLGLRQVVIKRLVHGMHPYKVLFWQSLLSLPVFWTFSAVFERDAAYSWTPPVLGAILYQGVVVAGLCFIIWVSLMKRHSASRLGAFGFATTVCGVLLSALLLDEALSWLLLLSTVLVAAGIVVVNREDD